jgi:hypothetical protein
MISLSAVDTLCYLIVGFIIALLVWCRITMWKMEKEENRAALDKDAEK